MYVYSILKQKNYKPKDAVIKTEGQFQSLRMSICLYINYSYKEIEKERGRIANGMRKEKKTRWRVTSAVLNPYIMTSTIY